MVPACSHKIPRVPWYSGSSLPTSYFNYGNVTLSVSPFQKIRLYSIVRYVSPLPLYISLYKGLGSYHFARHYFGNHCFIFFSSGYLDVSVPRVPSTTLCIHVAVRTPQYVGSPIRISTDLSSFATPRSFSQLVTSFFGA